MSKQYTHRLEWMSDDQWECYQMLADIFYGFHHVHGGLHPWGDGIALNASYGSNKFATFDFNALTRTVLMAHDRMIRFAIEPSGPGMLKLVLHKRHSREGHMYERHPTIQEAIATYRKEFEAEQTSDRDPDTADLKFDGGSGC